MLKRTVRWPASDVLWVSCVMTKRMRAFISRQTFVRNIFSSEIYVVLEDFAFQDQYDMAKEDEEGTLLAFTVSTQTKRQPISSLSLSLTPPSLCLSLCLFPCRRRC